MMGELREEYFEWICSVVGHPKSSRRSSYKKVLKHLFNTIFTYIIDMDGNRADDGINLRYRFGRDRRYPDSVISTLMGNGDCSVLEMMVALSIRCEETIMGNPDIGDRTSMWFWDMMTSLGLVYIDDRHYIESHVDMIVDIFLLRQYDRNGCGGLFTIDNSDQDLRNAEIWYQMCWYLNEIE